jgi:hypothetical protein
MAAGTPGSREDAMSLHGKLHEIVGGEVLAWLDNGVICLKAIAPNNADPVEMNEHEAEELVQVLQTLIRECR